MTRTVNDIGTVLLVAAATLAPILALAAIS